MSSMTIGDLWTLIYENDGCILEVERKHLAPIKRKLAKYKHRKVQAIGEDPGRLKIEIIHDPDDTADRPLRGTTKLQVRFTISTDNNSSSIPAKVLQIQGEEW